MPLETAANIMELNPAWPLGGDGKDEGDDHLRLLKTVIQALFPIGAVVSNTSGTNPSSYIGGTWQAFAPGRVLVGVGTSNTEDAFTWTALQELGIEEHRLTEEELASHVHWVDPPVATTSSSGNHTHSIPNITVFKDETVSGASDNAHSAGTQQSGAAGAHTHTIDIPGFESNGRGGNGKHNNIQPSVAVYHWLRTA